MSSELEALSAKYADLQDKKGESEIVVQCKAAPEVCWDRLGLAVEEAIAEHDEGIHIALLGRAVPHRERMPPQPSCLLIVAGLLAN